MKQTLTLSAPRSSAAQQLRRAASKISAKVFSERMATAVSCAGAAVSFMAAVTDHPRACAAIVAVSMPWFMSLLSGKGGEA